MIESIVVCERTTKDLKPINIKKVFFQSDFSIQILVQMGVISKDSNIKFHWYIDSNPEELIVIYEIPMPGNNEYPRLAVGGVEISQLFSQKSFNPLQKWFVLVEFENYKERIDFEIKPLYFHKSVESNSSISRYSWKA